MSVEVEAQFGLDTSLGAAKSCFCDGDAQFDLED
jgi:hypothetical protein